MTRSPDEINQVARARKVRSQAFTLVEMLVVIGVIGILAGLVLFMAGGASEKNQRGAAEALISQVKQAIDGYKDAKGYYPPENNKGDTSRPPLYYELKGTKSINANDDRQMLDDNHIIRAGDLDVTFGLNGLLNSKDQGETTEPVNFLPGLKSSNIGSPDGDDRVRFIVFPRPGPDGRFNPVHYDKSSGNLHNPGEYDIWVDLSIGGKTVTVGNWK